MSSGERRSADSDGPERERRRVLASTAAGGAGLVGLAGCLGGDGDGSSTPTATPLSNDTHGETDADDRDGAHDPGDAFRIGVLAPMNIPAGEAIWYGARLAADDLEAVLGRPVTLELGDTEVSPGKAQAEHRRLVAEEDCHATVGLFLGASLLQSMPSIATQETVHVTSGSMDPRVGELVSRSRAFQSEVDPEEEYEKYRYHFRVGPLHAANGAATLVEFVDEYGADYGWERVAVLTENLGELTTYHDELRAGLEGVVEVPIEKRPGGVSDWAPLFDEIESADCDVALVAMFLGGTTMVNQWTNQQRDFELGGIHAFSRSFDYWEETGGRIEHVFTTTAVTPQTENTPRTQPFVDRYVDRWDAVPMAAGALTYDAVGLLAQAFEAAGGGDGGDGLPESDAVVEHMEGMTYDEGVVHESFAFTGPDADYAHEPVWESMAEAGVPVIQQWQDDPSTREDYGTMHAIAPVQHRTADRTVPDWIDG